MDIKAVTRINSLKKRCGFNLVLLLRNEILIQLVLSFYSKVTTQSL